MHILTHYAMTMQLTIAGWIAVTRGVKMNYDLETLPLEIRTDSVLGSDEKVVVWFNNARGDIAGGVGVEFSSTHQYYRGYCTESWTNFPTTLPTATDKVWRVTVTRTAGIRVVIHCNDQEIINILLSDSTCSYSSWSTYWSRKIAQIEFIDSDTAPDFYRAGK